MATKTSLRINEEIYRDAVTKAAEQGVSITKYVNSALRAFNNGFHASVSLPEKTIERLMFGDAFERFIRANEEMAEALREISQTK